MVYFFFWDERNELACIPVIKLHAAGRRRKFRPSRCHSTDKSTLWTWRSPKIWAPGLQFLDPGPGSDLTLQDPEIWQKSRISRFWGPDLSNIGPNRSISSNSGAGIAFLRLKNGKFAILKVPDPRFLAPPELAPRSGFLSISTSGSGIRENVTLKS